MHDFGTVINCWHFSRVGATIVTGGGGQAPPTNSWRRPCFLVFTHSKVTVMVIFLSSQGLLSSWFSLH